MKKWLILSIPVIIVLTCLLINHKTAEDVPNTSDAENVKATTLPVEEETKNSSAHAFAGEELSNLELDIEPDSYLDDQNETENSEEETVPETKQSTGGGIPEGTGGSDMVQPPEKSSAEEY